MCRLCLVEVSLELLRHASDGACGRMSLRLAVPSFRRRMCSSTSKVKTRAAGPAGEVAVLSMDDGKMNAFSFDMISQIEQALDMSRSAGAVVLTGNERCFSAGFDLAVMGKAPSAESGELLEAGGHMLFKMLSYDRPLFMAAGGHALALGAIVLLSGDVRIGVADSNLPKPIKVGLNEVHIGMPLPRFGVEMARARLAPTHLTRSTTLGEVYDPAGAVAAGYLDALVPAVDLLHHTIDLAAKHAKLGTAFHTTKVFEREPLLEAAKNMLHRDVAAFSATSDSQ